MSRRKPKQLKLGKLSKEWQRADVPSNVVVIETEGKEVKQIVREMMAVPLDMSMLLDFLIGYERGDYRTLSDEQEELYRLQMLWKPKTGKD